MAKALTPIQEQRKRKARRLIASTAHKGNHGFTGASLRAWTKQRRLILVALRAVAKTGHATRLMCNQAMESDCPRYVSLLAQRGTARGATWVMDAKTTLAHIEHNCLMV